MRRPLLVATALLTAVTGLTGSAMAAAAPVVAADGVTTVCRFTDDRFVEVSGMTYSQRHPGVIYVHNDSGGGPFIYAVDASTCRTLATLTVSGIEARDIEAIASGRDAKGRPVLWLADIGDNNDSWPDVRLHRIREPAALTDRTVSARTFRFTYADRPHNAEAILADPNSSQVWVVTKQLAHGRLYALPARPSTRQVNVARPLRVEGGWITDGSVSPDGSRYVLRDYVDAQLFDGLPPGRPGDVVALPFQLQGEAVTWATDGSGLLIASERDDRLLRVPVGAARVAPSAVAASAGVVAPAATAWATPSPIAAPPPPQESNAYLWVVAGGVATALLIVAGGLAIARRRRERDE